MALKQERATNPGARQTRDGRSSSPEVRVFALGLTENSSTFRLLGRWGAYQRQCRHAMGAAFDQNPSSRLEGRGSGDDVIDQQEVGTFEKRPLSRLKAEGSDDVPASARSIGSGLDCPTRSVEGGQERTTEVRCQSSCDQFRLVEATLQAPSPDQRNRGHEVALRQDFCLMIPGCVGKPFGQVRPPRVLDRSEHRGDGRFIAPDRHQSAEGRWRRDAGVTPCVRPRMERQLRTTGGAARPRTGLESALAAATQTDPTQRLDAVAAAARIGKEPVE